MRSIVGTANKSIAQQKHQVSYGRLTKQHKELRARTLDVAMRVDLDHTFLWSGFSSA